MSQSIGLTRNQKATLRAIIVSADARARDPAKLLYTTYDGNAQGTIASLVRRGLAAWTPPGTRAWVIPTEAGRELMGMQ